MQTTANSNYTVLVVDDDDDFNNTLRDSLLDVGFNVLTVNSGLKAVKTLQYGNENVDVVLLDYNMPLLNGAQTLEHLKNQFPNVKTIGVTGLNTSQLPDTYRNGVEQLLVKPIKTSDLVTAIHSVLGIAANTKATARKAYWMKLGLWSVVFVIFCYEILSILGRLEYEALFLK
jgi:CheY-like chemotaxis protein